DVRTAGVSVAHQPFRLTVTVACTGRLVCENIPLTVLELVEEGAPVVLASGTVRLERGIGTVELPITLDRAGSRVVRVSIRAPEGDELPANDQRILTFNVTRDRVRILHIAGRPTYDTRAMRQWLKADGSLDVVAFFILRSLSDDVNATPDELALIRFPVDELFSEHLSSFDAVVLQDFDALSYGLTPYLSNLSDYVNKGGGLVMVGGLHGFSAGNYAGTPLETVLPVRLPKEEHGIDTAPFVPRMTVAGRETPVLEAVRALYGDRLPQMSGTNLLDEARDGAVVLWEHPTLTTTRGKPMPVLALGEHGNGRVVALSVDGTHRLAFSEMASQMAGRGYGALWDALLGWLMRDPRYEPARVELLSPCLAGRATPVRIHRVPGLQGEVQARLVALGSQKALPDLVGSKSTDRSFTAELPALDAGGYALRLQIGKGASTRFDFACEQGGDEWADPRPDVTRLQTIA
ncbi:MAG TPA: glutamine amidotransferase, partial [Polyangiaceae bacterium]|nr:glutamine amidotransferase [Polyangiaceae bacterium]